MNPWLYCVDKSVCIPVDHGVTFIWHTWKGDKSVGAVRTMSK